jgi:hypothetical protein
MNKKGDEKRGLKCTKSYIKNVKGITVFLIRLQVLNEKRDFFQAPQN